MRNIFGWFGLEHADTVAAQTWLGGAPALRGSGWTCSTDRESGLAQDGTLTVALSGRPYFPDAATQPKNPAAHILELWRQHGVATLPRIHGVFALALLDTESNSTVLAIDRVGVHALAFARLKDGLVFANRADRVATHPAVHTDIDLQSLFHYFYFYNVPAPRSIFQGVEKLLPGQYARFQNGQVKREFYWHLDYYDTPRSDFDAMSGRFKEILRESVTRARGDDEVAAFLSGGTDSSTVAGILTQMQGKPARTYSIGFSAEGFDEMEYARIAGRHFGLDMREYYLKPDDVLAAIPVIAEHYDEPFANESAVPTYHCAKMAHTDGFKVMLAGDGGDELFGGNTRYAKQKVFEMYHALPALLRNAMIEPLSGLPGLDRLPPTRKLQSYIRQANIPLPDRMESYNYIYRQPLPDMFTPDFLAQIDRDLPAVGLREVYARTDSSSFINRMMHLDMKFTIADSDLRKVNGMTEAAGIEVRYPLLDDAMVDFSGEVPPDWKVRGYYLRWFFKTALKDFLPQEIINKSKHGFGLPFGVWARDHAPLRERIDDRIADFKKRGWVQPAYIDRLREQHRTEHATYFGKMLWVIAILEEWLARHGK